MELAQHKKFTVATDVQVYFCDPQSPWQRGTNENTNGLLRQYFPRGTRLDGYSQADLNKIALQLNQRPRKTLGFMTPADKLNASVGVAFTGWTRHVVNFILFLLTLAAGALFDIAANAQQVPPVDVKVSVEPSSGFTIYHYRVVNAGTRPITALQIGFDYYHGAPELQTMPLNAQENGMPQSSATSPPGWNVVMYTTEETDKVDLAWSVTNLDASIAPGSSLAGFSVKVPNSDQTYTTSHWTVSLNGGGDAAFSAPLSLERFCSPPRLAVAVSPNVLWPPNHEMVKVTAMISVKDDFDQNPLITLVSVVSNPPGNLGDISADVGTAATSFSVMSARQGNDKAGRVYSATYSAKNYCGSVSTAAATVVVPHDKGK
jgi:hypothetical protein